MTDREKLIELIRDGRACPIDRNPFDDETCKSCKYLPDVDCDITRLADYLIVNGVTFATDTNVGSKWELDLSCLTPRERTAIQMYYEDAVSLTDVAVELELNYNRAAYVLDKARRKLFKNIRITNRRKRPLPEPPKEE